MKSSQFEELTAALSIIIALLAYHVGFMWVFWVFAVKGSLDTVAVIMEAYKEYKSRRHEV